jgi:predicted nucleotidyltransferase
MLKKEYKPTLLTIESYNILKNAKRDLSEHSAGRVTFTDVINEYVKKQLVLQHLESSVKDYIYSFVNESSKAPQLKGVILFGSMAKGNYNKFSDIDLFMMIDGDERAFYEKVIKGVINEIEKKRKALVDGGWYLRISPLIMSLTRISRFTPIFLDVLDYGITLYDRDNTANDFLNSLRKIKHKRINISGEEVLEWK